MLVVIDDSSNERSRSSNRALLRNCVIPKADTCYFDRTSRSQLLNSYSHALRAGNRRFLRKVTKPLGARYWDIAGVRNMGASIALTLLGSDGVCTFIDDDIVVVQGKKPSRRGVLSQLERYARVTRGVVGAKLIGIPDASRFRRLRELLEVFRSFPLSRLAEKFDKYVELVGCNQQISLHCETIGSTRGIFGMKSASPRYKISGGLMTVHVAALKSAPFPNLYNEDWLWCMILERVFRYSITIATIVAHHMPPAVQSLTTSDLLEESMGEVLFRALRGHRINSESCIPTRTAIRSELMAYLAELAIVRGECHTLVQSILCGGCLHDKRQQGIYRFLQAVSVGLKETEAQLNAEAIGTIFSRWMAYLAGLKRWNAISSVLSAQVR